MTAVKYTQFFFGALAFYIVDRFIRMIGSRHMNGSEDKEYKRCQVELALALLISTIVIFMHLKK